MSRPYQAVSFLADEAGFALLLDGKPALTPRRTKLCVPTEALVQAVAKEWDAQDTKIQPDTMPLTRFAAIALDVAAEHRAQVVADTAAYSETDLLCYRADNDPYLRKRQETLWEPIVIWAREHYGIALTVAEGIMPVAQPPASLERLEKAVSQLDNFSLAAIAFLTRATTSLLLPLALFQERITAEELITLSQLEERFQTERWGEDAEKEAKLATLAQEITAAGLFLDYLKR